MRRFVETVRAKWRADAPHDADVRRQLVESLYASPRALTIGAIAGVAISGMLAAKAHDARLTVICVAVCIVAGLRLATALYFRRRRSQASCNLEAAYEIGAWFYAALIGMLALATLCFSRQIDLHLLAVALATGYAGGVAGRNAGRIHIAIGQSCLALLPTAIGLALDGGAAYRLLAAVLCLMMLGLAEVSATTHRIVLDAIAGKQEESQLATKYERLARFDSLTGVENRMAMQLRLRALFDGGGSQRDGLAVLWVDLDRFKEINDSLGHIVGDHLLRTVAARLERAVKGVGHVARFGGDEFILLCPAMDRAAAGRLAQVVLDGIAEPMDLDGHRLAITGSLGIAVGPQDGRDADELLQHADMALYQAKDMGRNRYASFGWGMKERFNRAHDIESGLRQAIDNGEMSIRYQPIFDIATGQVVSCEALLRWTHPRLRDISPEEFVPIAEGNGMIGPITHWVMETAMKVAAGWPEHIRLAVNLSPALLKSADLSRLVIGCLLTSGLRAGRLELEVTESVFLDSNAQTNRLLTELQKTGMRLAIDDFGTGYSSLGYLRTYPFDTIKIDQSFMRGAATSAEGSAADRAVTHAVADLARRLEIDTVAEGIETREQLLYAREIGIDHAQGYYLCKPMMAEEMGAVLRDGVDVARPVQVMHGLRRA